MTSPPSRRASDAGRMPLRDRLRWHRARICRVVREWSNFLLLVLLAASVALAAISLVQARGAVHDAQEAAHRAAGALRAQRAAESVNADRDAARTFQRCEQNRELIEAVNGLIVRGNALLGRLPLVDEPNCRRTYPRGARQSRNYPDVAPTSPPKIRRK